MLDDIRHWANYSPEPWPAEVERTVKIVGVPKQAEELLRFGFRPLSYLDENPAAQPHGDLNKPFEVTAAYLSDEDILVDIFTGYRFRYLPEFRSPVFDLLGSNNYIDAQELLMLAAHRESPYHFETYKQRTYFGGFGGPKQVWYTNEATHVRPLTLHVSSRSQLEDVIDNLNTLFCHTCPSKRLWFRGQRQEYLLQRSTDLCQKFYGVSHQASLLPSAGRFARENPEKMGFGLAFSGPNHQWKKPFLIWIMRENSNWFARDPRALEMLSRVLSDDEDMSFTKVLIALELNSQFAGLSEDIVWPDEADDLRQWFFAFMKPHSFGITLQQYGYITSLLDLTEDLDIALYFSQSRMIDGRMRKQPPEDGRLIYVFAERRSADFFRHGKDLFWGDNDWVRQLPPRLERQRAGFLMGSTCRAQNFYNNMVVAKIYLQGESIETSLEDYNLFPPPKGDLLYRTLLESRPPLEGLY
jgi:hypothetical protein